MEDITLRQCLKGAWRDAASAVRHMPIVFLVAFVAVLATATAGYKAQFPGMAASGGSLTAMTSSSAGHAAGFAQGLISLGVTFVQTLVLAVLAVFVVRFAMKLNAEPAAASASPAPVLPATHLWDAGIRRYFLLCIALIAGYVGATLAVMIVWIGLRLAGLSSGTSMAATATLASAGRMRRELCVGAAFLAVSAYCGWRPDSMARRLGGHARALLVHHDGCLARDPAYRGNCDGVDRGRGNAGDGRVHRQHDHGFDDGAKRGHAALYGDGGDLFGLALQEVRGDFEGGSVSDLLLAVFGFQRLHESGLKRFDRRGGGG